MPHQPKNPKIAAILAFSSLVLPISGLHKFYLRQPLWGVVYLALAWWTPIPSIASALEGIWYLMQQDSEFNKNFNSGPETTTESDRLAMSFVTQNAIEPIQRWWTIADAKLASVLGTQVDVNRAKVADWQKLPVTLEQAQILVNLSQAGIQFYCIEDLAAALSLPPSHFQPWQSILKFCYYEAGTQEVGKVNPNRASWEMLLHVPGVDADLARAIVADRLTAGAYQNLADLQQRLSLPGGLTSDLMHYLQF